MRQATPEDLGRILLMGRAFHEAAGNPFEYDPEATGKAILDMMRTGCVLVTERGMIGGILAPTWCQPDWKVAVELFWWSEDGTGRQLLRGFEDWAREQGANEIRMTTLAGLEVADKVLGRAGYDRREASYTKVI